MYIGVDMSTIDAVPHNECVGCALCHDVCPAGAIEMQSDGKGFLQPVIDHDACVIVANALRAVLCSAMKRIRV